MDSDENEPTSSTHVPDDSNSATQQTTFNAKNQINEASIESSSLNLIGGDAQSVTNTNNSNNNKTSTSVNITVGGGSGNSDTPQQTNPATDSQPPQEDGESLHIRIWNFVIKARGKTAMIIATGGTFIVCESLLIIHDLCKLFASHPNQAATCIATGSINVQVLTKGGEAMKILLRDYFSGKITREVKKILKEALKKEDAKCEIESVTLAKVGVVMADQEVFDKIKRETEQTLSQLSTSQDLFKNKITLSTTSTILHDKYQVMTEKISSTATEDDVINEIRNLQLRLQTQTTKAASPESISKSQSTSEKHSADLSSNPEADAKPTGGEVLRLFHSRRLSSSSSDSSSDEDESFLSKRLESLRIASSDAELIMKSVGSDSSALMGTRSRGLDSPEYRYNMNHHERGCFLIFILMEHQGFIRRYRKMFNNEAKRLKNMAKELGFEHVRIIEDETEENLTKLLTELSQADHSNYDCFACAILGCCIDEEMYTLRVRDGYMLVEDFMERFSADNCRSLAMKPKLFFINNFKEEFSRTRDARLWEMHIPSDFLVVNSTLPERSLGLHELFEQHSTFIRCLCATMEAHGDTIEIMQAVAQANRMTAREYSSYMLPFHQMKIPSIRSTYTREVYFPRKKIQKSTSLDSSLDTSRSPPYKSSIEMQPTSISRWSSTQLEKMQPQTGDMYGAKESIIEPQSTPDVHSGDVLLNPKVGNKKTGGEVVRLFHHRKSVGSDSSALKGTQSMELDSPDTENRYNMNHHERGCFLIFILTEPYELMESYRKIINDEAERCKNMAKVLGFEHVLIIQDETEENIKKLLTELSQADHSNYDCFSFKKEFTITRDVSLWEMHIPSDFLVVNFTAPECSLGLYELFEQRSTFIRCLCATMEAHGDTIEIMQAVAQAIRKIIREYSSHKLPFHQMHIPLITSRLTREVYFPRKKIQKSSNLDSSLDASRSPPDKSSIEVQPTSISRLRSPQLEKMQPQTGGKYRAKESIIEPQSTPDVHLGDVLLNPKMDNKKTGGEVVRLFHHRKSVDSDSSVLKGTQSIEPDSPDTENRYNMNHHERGCFFIFILTESYSRTYQKKMNNDAKSLMSQADHSNYDCFACAILGFCVDLKGQVLHVRDGYMPMKDFMEPFSADNCRSLAMKPKLFFYHNFTQEPIQTRGVRLWKTHIPTDFLIVHSTVPPRCFGQFSTFLQCLCATMEAHGDTMEIMQAVAQANRMIAREYSSHKLPFNQMEFPTITSRLAREVYVPRKKMMTFVSRMDVHEHSVDKSDSVEK